MNDLQATTPRHPKLKAALRQARAGGAVPSPCVGVCRMDAASGYCLGCWRTLDEIAHWSASNADEQWACWRRIEGRIGPGQLQGAETDAPVWLGCAP